MPMYAYVDLFFKAQHPISRISFRENQGIWLDILWIFAGSRNSSDASSEGDAGVDVVDLLAAGRGAIQRQILVTFSKLFSMMFSNM